MNWLNYHHLFYFHMIVKEDSLTRAAKKLRLTPSTLSTQLAVLENQVGHPLFVRQNRKLILTDTGRMVEDYAAQIFSLGNDLMNTLTKGVHAPRQPLFLGILDGVPKSIAAELSREALRDKHGRVSILENEGGVLLREMLAHHLDLLILNFKPGPMSMDFESRLLLRSPVSLYGGRPFIKLRKGFPRSIAGHPIMLPTVHSKLQHDVQHWFRTHQLGVEPILEAQDTALLKSLALEGLGMIPLSTVAAKTITRRGFFERIGELKEVYEEYWLVGLKRQILHPIAKRLFDSFRLSET